MPHEDEWLTLREFATRAGIDLDHARNHVNAGRIPGAKKTKNGVHRWLIPASSVDLYLDNGGEFPASDWLTTADVAHMTGYSPGTVRKMAACGVWVSRRGVGKGGPGTGHIRIKRSSVEAWLAGGRDQLA